MLGVNRGSEETLKRIPQGSHGVELGVWKGESSEKFLKKAAKLELVDPWSVVAYEESDEFGNYDGYLNRYAKLVGSRDPKDFQKYYNKLYQSVKKKFEGTGARIWRCTTEQFFSQFTEQVDWVYVDALHSFDGCLSDLRHARQIIKPGGSIFGDDYGNKKGVVQAVDTFISETGLVLDNFYTNQYQIRI